MSLDHTQIISFAACNCFRTSSIPSKPPCCCSGEDGGEYDVNSDVYGVLVISKLNPKQCRYQRIKGVYN